jgi:hypothetical protein
MSFRCIISLLAPPPTNVRRTVIQLVRTIEKVAQQALDVVSEPGRAYWRPKDRDGFVSRRYSSANPSAFFLPFFSNGSHADGFVGVEGASTRAEGRAPAFRVNVMVPLGQATKLAPSVLSHLSLVLGSWWGRSTTPGLMQLHVRQRVPPYIFPSAVGLPFKPPPGLPALELDFSSPWRPEELGWHNHWSDRAAVLAGLKMPPDPDCIAHIERTNNGWFLRLTDEPLDPSKAQHMKRLKAAYHCFPGVGRPDKGRSR